MAQPVVSVVVNKLADYLQKEASLLHGVSDEVAWLERELRGMLCFLKDADSKRKGNDERVKNWVRDVREVAYEAVDIIDDFVLKVGSHASSQRYMSQLTSVIPSCKISKKIEKIKISKKIEKIKARIKEISDRRATYGIANIGEIEGEGGRFLDENIEARRRLSPHHYDDRSIVGLEEDKKEILKQLFNAEKRRCVISIIGMGGLGKSTLAKKVYNSTEVIEKFPCRAWVSVSQDHRVTEFLKKIIETIIGKQDTENLDEENLKEKLYWLLQNQGRYLIVMDDVWRQEVWERVDTAFYDAENGSRVIFTTRQREVAKHANPTTTPYELQLLNQAESRKLLLKKAYPYEDIQKFPRDLEDIGEKLVSKCHGLPLALVVLGGLLSRREKSLYAWSRVLNSSDWQTTEGCRPILSLSYEDLPYELKSCYLYIGSFPEDFEIDTERLIRLWIAEGFVTEQLQKTREDKARDFLDELIQRCMVQVVTRNMVGAIKGIRIHDLLRDLCLDEAGEVGFLMVKNKEIDDTSTASNAITARRLALHNHKDFSYLNLSMEHKSRKKLQSLLGFSRLERNDVISKTIVDALDDLRLLRVIDVKIILGQQKVTMMLPKEISAMIHLRHLQIEFVPAGRTLLPYIGNLRNLRTLVGYAVTIGSNSGIGNLKDLQHLGGITAGRWIQRDLAKLTSLCNLRIEQIKPSHEQALVRSLGKLHRLEFLDLVGELIPAESLAVLSNHHRLRQLNLFGPFSQLSFSGSGLPPNLSVLHLLGSGLKQDPMAVLENLPHLVVLQLWGSYEGRSMCCSAGGFPHLQFMDIQILPELEEWCVEAGAMPCLTHLHMNRCEKLKVLPEGLQHVTTLQVLKLRYMPKELEERVRPEEGEEGRDWCKIRHVPYFNIITTNEAGTVNQEDIFWWTPFL